MTMTMIGMLATPASPAAAGVPDLGTPPSAMTGARAPAVIGDSASYRLNYAFDPVDNRTRVVRWNPCEPISYRINAALGGRGAAQDAKAAVQRLAAATGITFRYAGETTFVPSPGRPQRNDMELVISWAEPSMSGHLKGDADGYGGWRTGGRVGEPLQIVSGYVVLSSAQHVKPGFGPGITRGRMLLHELGHAVGLGHVDDPAMMMHDEVSPRSSPAAYQAGDLAGLREVGRQAGCR